MATAKTNIRDLAPSARQFWKQAVVDQLSQKVFDQNVDYHRRELPMNEVTVLSLNEIAVQHRKGFFFHLPPRPAWTTQADTDRIPPERVAKVTSADYPTIIYMPLVWSDKAVARFLADSHRGRYLRSNAFINPPASDTPLYGVQYAYQRCPVFQTSVDTQVMFATKGGYYVARTSVLVGILGIDNAGKLGSANWLWDQSSLDKGRDHEKRKSMNVAMRAFHLASLEEVYQHIVLQCSGGGLKESLMASEVGSIIPRPQPIIVSSGRALGSGLSANAPSRRGEKRKFRHRGTKRKLEGEEQAAEQDQSVEADD
ncbi:hypothetical protein LTR37_014096 [Vermiconidia calcicola]|uniref:Uncharacterized protein n=1 Tax=Vermiconidia calcicola TaxID=1690605 RepID=A0ACC3MUK7_9PEZI|nr:hypothetical protein LTR37_014096 [Vermiconidia calcicola]